MRGKRLVHSETAVLMFFSVINKRS